MKEITDAISFSRCCEITKTCMGYKTVESPSVLVWQSNLVVIANTTLFRIGFKFLTEQIKIWQFHMIISGNTGKLRIF